MEKFSNSEIVSLKDGTLQFMGQGSTFRIAVADEIFVSLIKRNLKTLNAEQMNALNIRFGESVI